MKDGVGSHTWRLILTDWFNSNATVTITLKSGVQLTGKVPSHPSNWLHDLATLNNGPSRIHNIDLTEIAAISAVSP